MESLLEPTPFNAGEHIFDVAFHPNNDIFACTMITGEVKLVSYSLEETKELITLNHHKKSARTCAFAPSGSFMATASEDRSLAIVDSDGKLVMKIKRAHECPIYSMKFLSDDVVATGDDDGIIKIWNLQDGKCVWEVAEQEGTITDMSVNSDNTMLCATSNDGTLGVYDMRKGNNSKDKLFALSDSMEEDLLAVSLVKNGRKVLCSSQEGCIYVFKWGDFGDCKDRILGHPNSIDAMVKIDENTVLTGSEDGFIRAVGIHPNKILNYVGNHADNEEIEPVTRLALSRDLKYVASLSHDGWVKFHNITNIVEQRSQLKKGGDNEDGDSDDEDGMNEEDSDDEEGEDGAQKKMPRKTNVKLRQKEITKQKKQDFFSDM